MFALQRKVSKEPKVKDAMSKKSDVSRPLPKPNNYERPVPSGPPPTNIEKANKNNEKHFPEYLWNSFEEIYQHATDGRNDMKTMKSYLLARSHCEHKYSKELLSIANKHSDFCVRFESDLSKIWKQQRDGAITMGNQHEQLAKACESLAKDLEKEIVEAKGVKTACNAAYKKSNLDLIKKTKKHNQLKNSYGIALEDAEEANSHFNNTIDLPAKDKAKLEAALGKAMLVLNNTHSAYEAACKDLNIAQHAHEKLIHQLLIKMEEYERIRIKKVIECFRLYTLNQDYMKNSLDQMLVWMQDF